MKPMTDSLRKRIKQHIKNRLDISELIKDIDIRNEDFSYAIIRDFERISVDISGVNLSHAIIGREDKITRIISCKIKNSVWTGAQFIGKVFFRRNVCYGSDFGEVNAAHVEYQHTDFRGCTFCGIILRLGTDYAFGSKFDDRFFQDLATAWNIEIKQKEGSKNE